LIVADTNIIVHLYVESESSPMARQVMLRDPDWTSPVLWRSEFRNALVTCLRSGFLQPEFPIPFPVVYKPFEYGDLEALIAKTLRGT